MATAELTTFDTSHAMRPFRITLHASPPKRIVGGALPGLLSAILQGANGIPVLAIRDLVVELSVSDPNVVMVAATATIPANSYFTTTTIIPLATGTAILPAMSAGFVSEFMAVHVVEPGEVAASLSVYVSPPILMSGIAERPSIIVQAFDEREIPVNFPCREIKLSSSYPSSASASSSLLEFCDTDRQFAVAGLEVGTVPGTPTIVVAGTGLTPDSTGVTVHGQTPAKLNLYTAPHAPLAIDSVPGYLVVQVVDDTDAPVTLHQGIKVSFQGANLAATERAFIPAGNSFTKIELARFETSVLKSLIWAVSEDLASSQATIEIQSVNMYVLIDQTERPAFVNQPRVTEVTVRSEVAPIGQVELVWSTDSGLITHAKSYTDDRGEARATFMGANVGDVTIGVTAIKAGFPVATTKVEISVVSAPKSTSDQPSFFGVPVRVLFALALLSLIGFMVLRVRHALRMRLGKILR